ncbi:hypothetical protein CspHIS471_0401140 [Cutaneotrichosporon sp. HIS471]|nr:hypothetical protein CspHIS471_0401140 [Cutaneotrichosporon sp. HIS471]
MKPPSLRLSATISSSLHPHLRLSPLNPDPTSSSPSSCLQVRLHLPDALFVDPDELVDLWGGPSLDLSSKPSLGADQTSPVWSLSPRIVDIERPESPTLPPQSLKSPQTGQSKLDLVFTGAVDVPLHARYLVPDAAEGSWDAMVKAFNGDIYRDVPLGRVEAAYCGERLEVVDTDAVARLPVGDAAYRLPVEIVTAAVVWAGWAWVVYALVRATRAKVKTD